MVDTDPSAGDRLNVHVIMSPVVNDSRVIKEARALLKADLVDRVIFAGLREKGLDTVEEPEEGIGIVRFRLRSRDLPRRFLPQVIKYVEWGFRVLFRFGSRKPILLIAHDLEALPIAVLLKTLTGAPLHYDAHELEVHRLGMSGYRQKLAYRLEKFLVRFVDSQSTVSDAIAQWYADEYHIALPTVVRNIPDDSTSSPHSPSQAKLLREAAGLSPTDIAYLYVGGISPARGIPSLVDTFESLPNEHPGRLVLLGPRSMDLTSTDRVRVLDPVPHDEVHAWIKGADVGFSLLDDSCLNHRYALPNKLFQYLLAGIPVIASPYPEMRRLLEPAGAGWFAADPNEVRELILKLRREDINNARARAQELAADLSWADEAAKFIATIAPRLRKKSPN